MTAKKCTKKREVRAELLICQSKPTAFLPISLINISLINGCDPKFCYYGNVTSNFSLFLPWLICHLIYSQSLLQLTLPNVYLTIMSITQEERKMNWPFLKVLTFHSSCVSADGDCASSASLDLKKKNVISVNYSRRVSFNFVSRIAWEFHRDAIHVHQVSLGVLSV